MYEAPSDPMATGSAFPTSLPADIPTLPQPPAQIPATPVDPTPALVGVAPASPAGTPSTPGAPDPNAWKAELSSKYGQDVSGFSNKEDALNALRMHAERVASDSLRGAPLQPAAPPVPGVPTPAEPVPAQLPEGVNLDDEDLDPKVAKALQAMQADYQAKLSEMQVQQESVSKEVQQREAIQAATEIFDTMQSPEYGVGGNRTATQQLAVRRVFQIADLLYDRPGVQDLSMKNILELAVLMDGGNKAPQQMPASAALEISNNNTAGAGPLPYGQPPVTPRSKDPNDPLGLKQDPAFLAQYQRVINS